MNRPDVGRAEEIAPGLRRILAPNAGPMTHWGTNTFLFGETEIAVIDPGPDSQVHLQAILSACEGQTITHILVTHAHLDHSPLARTLSARSGAPVLAFGTAAAGRSATMQSLAETGLAGGGEGVDIWFAPDRTVKDGEKIEAREWTLKSLHTPGHFAGHVAFGTDDWLISGDHVMDWASSLVSPPDGDLTAFMTTSRRLLSEGPALFFPAHGNPICAPQERLQWLIDHRLHRENAILNTLTDNPTDIPSLTRHVYTDIDQIMLPAAERNVFAHLIDLVGRNLAIAHPTLSPKARYQRT